MACTTNETKTLVVPTPQWAWKVGRFVCPTFGALIPGLLQILKTEFILNTKIAFAPTEPPDLTLLHSPLGHEFTVANTRCLKKKRLFFV